MSTAGYLVGTAALAIAAAAMVIAGVAAAGKVRLPLSLGAPAMRFLVLYCTGVAGLVTLGATR